LNMTFMNSGCDVSVLCQFTFLMTVFMCRAYLELLL
jgi:hypothetical protein